jgi:hypothetical protein
MIKNTVACYGGEQGQNIGRTIITLDASKKMQTGENDVFVLGPEVGEKPELLALVKQFNDAFNDKMRKLEKERVVQTQKETAGETKQSVDHFVGTEVCQRCHMPEYAQWLKTDHAKAWQTLVDQKKESTPECVTCHVVGYKQSGGFQTADDAPKLGNVQCENCHGMGAARGHARRRSRSPRRPPHVPQLHFGRCSTSRSTSRTSCITRRPPCRRCRRSRRTA